MRNPNLDNYEYYHSATGDKWRFKDNHFFGSHSIGFESDTFSPFKAGDTVYIKQDAGYLNEGYNGVHKVLKVNNTTKPYTVEVTGMWGKNSPPNGGLMTWIEPDSDPDLDTAVGDLLAGDEGMSTAVKIGIGIGIVALILGGIVAYNKFKKN